MSKYFFKIFVKLPAMKWALKSKKGFAIKDLFWCVYALKFTTITIKYLQTSRQGAEIMRCLFGVVLFSSQLRRYI